MRIPALALALLAAALSGSANAGPESKAQLPKLATAAHGPEHLAGQNTPTAAYTQEVVDPGSLTHNQRRQDDELPNRVSSLLLQCAFLPRVLSSLFYDLPAIQSELGCVPVRPPSQVGSWTRRHAQPSVNVVLDVCRPCNTLSLY